MKNKSMIRRGRLGEPAAEEPLMPGFLTQISPATLAHEGSRKLFGLEAEMKQLSAFAQLCLDPNRREELARLDIYPTALLYGPPNSGKTSLARQLFLSAKQGNLLSSKAKLYSVDLSILLDPELGQSSRNVDQLFAFLTGKRGPSFLIIDELDAICTSRDNTNEHDGVRRTMTSFMLCLDQIRASSQLVVIGITNMIRLIDAAVVRRFFFRLEIDPVLSLESFSEYCRYLLNTKNDDMHFQSAHEAFLKKGFSVGDLRSVAARALIRASLHGKQLSVAELIISLQEERSTRDQTKDNAQSYRRRQDD